MGIPTPYLYKTGGDLSTFFNVFLGGRGGSRKCSLHLDRSSPFLGFENPLQETSETRFGGGRATVVHPKPSETCNAYGFVMILI